MKGKKEVIDILNRYLTEMSDAMLAHGGTVVSYMGDGIMALFGAPLEQATARAKGKSASVQVFGLDQQTDARFDLTS